MSRRKPDTMAEWFEITMVFHPPPGSETCLVLRVITCGDKKDERSFAWWASTESAWLREAPVGEA